MHEIRSLNYNAVIDTNRNLVEISGIKSITIEQLEKLETQKRKSIQRILYKLQAVSKPIENLSRTVRRAVTSTFKKLQKVLSKFHDCFREELPEELPSERLIDHVIDTGDAKPINRNTYSLSPVHLREQTAQVTKMIEQGLIRQSSSP